MSASMRSLKVVVIYLFAVFVGGALLAPWLYWLAQMFAESIPWIASQPFNRYVNRSLIGIALVGLWPLFKNLGANSPRDLGIVKPWGQWKYLGSGFLLGLLSLATLAFFAFISGSRQIKESIQFARLGQILASAALSAGVVSVLEEILFRGALFGLLRKNVRGIAALLLSSMIYAIVHFMERVELAGPVTWLSGLELLPQMLQGFGNLNEIVPGFFNLTLAGIVLALAYQKTGNLYFSIGLHAGWIFWLRPYGFFTESVASASADWWGSSKLIDGWATFPLLTATLLVFTKLRLERRDSKPV
jgi:membrane protease YdiL (CAAX protease family)